MIAASLIFCVLGAFLCVVGSYGFAMAWTERMDALGATAAAIVIFCIAAGFFAAADMIWRAA